MKKKAADPEQAPVDLADRRERLRRMSREVEAISFDFAREIFEVMTRKWYRIWGYRTFAQYSETELKIQRRMAYYWASLHSRFFAKPTGVTQELIKELGRTKACIIASAQYVPDDQLVPICKRALTLSTNDLEDLLKTYRDPLAKPTPKYGRFSVIVPLGAVGILNDVFEQVCEWYGSDNRAYVLERCFSDVLGEGVDETMARRRRELAARSRMSTQ